MTLSVITLTGSFATFANSAASGAILITPTSEVVNSSGLQVLAASPIAVQLSTAGTFSQPDMICTNNTGLQPPNWCYQFSVAVPGAVSTFAAYLPSTYGSTADISQLIPAPNPPSLTGPYVQSINGQSGTVTITASALDPSASDIKPAGQSASAGSGTLAPFSNHVHPPGSVFLCSPAVYAPATQTALTVSSATMAAFSSASVNTGAFTAPVSGEVVVSAAFAGEGTAGIFTAFGLAQHGTTTMEGVQYQTETSSSGAVPVFTLSFAVSGLTSGTSYTFDLMGASTGTFTIFAYGQTSTVPTLGSGGRGGPVVMTVQAV